MARLSTAPDLRAADGLTSLARAQAQPLMLGLFLPHQQGAWTPSRAPRGTSWTFEYNAELAVRADELGFDLVFALATWLGKGGHGVDGVQVNFFDFVPDLEYFAEAVLPPMREAGLRR